MDTSSFLIFVESSSAEPLVGELFRRKFGDPPPAVGRHFVSLVRAEEGHLHVLGYTHFMPFDSVMLGGGACTDERVLRLLSRPQRNAISVEGGAYYLLLSFAIGRLRQRCEALFGYCGDKRAEDVDLRAGFKRTTHKHLLALFAEGVPPSRQQRLVESVAALGPF